MLPSLKSKQRSTSHISPFDDFFRKGFMDIWEPDQATVPSVNILENDKEYLVDLAVPGMKKEDFNIDVDGNLITVSCEKETETKEDGKDNFARREYNYSSFSRTFTIPDNAMAENVKAKYADGILQLNIPKNTEAKKKGGQKIKVE
jgi:HSP20 family protein